LTIDRDNSSSDLEMTMIPFTTTVRSCPARTKVLALVGVLASAVVALPVSIAQAEVGLAGVWNGSGSVQLPSGASEKAKCKATFRKRGATTFVMDAVCASSSARAAQTASLQQVGPNKFSGDFTNAEFNVSGSINVTVNGNSLTASLNGGGATANFNLSK
jgi:hypothetical protein